MICSRLRNMDYRLTPSPCTVLYGSMVSMIWSFGADLILVNITYTSGERRSLTDGNHITANYSVHEWVVSRSFNRLINFIKKSPIGKFTHFDCSHVIY